MGCTASIPKSNTRAVSSEDKTQNLVQQKSQNSGILAQIIKKDKVGFVVPYDKKKMGDSRQSFMQQDELTSTDHENCESPKFSRNSSLKSGKNSSFDKIEHSNADTEIKRTFTPKFKPSAFSQESKQQITNTSNTKVEQVYETTQPQNNIKELEKPNPFNKTPTFSVKSAFQNANQHQHHVVNFVNNDIVQQSDVMKNNFINHFVNFGETTIQKDIGQRQQFQIQKQQQVISRKKENIQTFDINNQSQKIGQYKQISKSNKKQIDLLDIVNTVDEATANRSKIIQNPQQYPSANTSSNTNSDTESQKKNYIQTFINNYKRENTNGRVDLLSLVEESLDNQSKQDFTNNLNSETAIYCFQIKEKDNLEQLNFEHMLGLLDPPSPINNLLQLDFQSPYSNLNGNDSFPKSDNNLVNDSIISYNYQTEKQNIITSMTIIEEHNISKLDLSKYEIIAEPIHIEEYNSNTLKSLSQIDFQQNKFQNFIFSPSHLNNNQQQSESGSSTKQFQIDQKLLDSPKKFNKNPNMNIPSKFLRKILKYLKMQFYQLFYDNICIQQEQEKNFDQISEISTTPQDGYLRSKIDGILKLNKQISDLKNSENQQQAAYKKYSTLLDNSHVIHTSKLDRTVDQQGNNKINQYILLKDIGRGAFGKVKLFINEDNNKEYAIKVADKVKLKRKLLAKSKSTLSTLETEIAIMKKMNHNNIVKLFEVIDDPEDDKLYLVMEFVKKGAIMSKTYWKYEFQGQQETSNTSQLSNESNSLQQIRTIPEKKARKYFRDLIIGLDYLHNYANVIHRDIKPENLLVDEFDELKIADFGISTIMEDGSDQLHNNAGTKHYMAPESWTTSSFRGKPLDIWAARGTLYYFVVGKVPFQTQKLDELKYKVLNEEPEYPLDMNHELKDLIQKCLIKNPNQRISLDDIQNHVWLTENNVQEVQNHFTGHFQITENDIRAAITKVSMKTTLMLTLKMKRKANDIKKKVEYKRQQSINQ